MDNNTLTKKNFLYDQNFCLQNHDKTCWSTEINQILTRDNLLFSIDNSPPKLVIKMLHDSLLKKDIVLFRTKCLAATKLRTYNTLFSRFVSHMSTVKFTRLGLPFIVRKQLAQLRLGVLPLKIETDCFFKIPLNERFCRQPKCLNITNSQEIKPVENETHFMLHCPQYSDLRQHLYSSIPIPNFEQLNDNNKFIRMLTHDSVTRLVGQYIVKAFDVRICRYVSSHLYQNNNQSIGE